MANIRSESIPSNQAEPRGNILTTPHTTIEGPPRTQPRTQPQQSRISNQLQPQPQQLHPSSSTQPQESQPNSPRPISAVPDQAALEPASTQLHLDSQQPQPSSPRPISAVRDQAALRGSILDSAIKSQIGARSSQGELERQGDLLRKSLRYGREISARTLATRKQVEGLIDEAKLGRGRRLLRCCCGCLSATCWRKRGAAEGDATPMAQQISIDEEEDELRAQLDRLNKLLRRKQQQASWRRTLNPSSSLWSSQMDASLHQLQLVAEEMSKTLEQQTKLADLLTIYLNHAADRALDSNKRLAEEKRHFD